MNRPDMVFSLYLLYLHPNYLEGGGAFFFFQKKKQKALFRFAEGDGLPKPLRSRPRGSGGVPPETGSVVESLLFRKKKQKALFRFAEGDGLPKPRRSRPRGSGGVPPET
jgi:hypothetical protein